MAELTKTGPYGVTNPQQSVVGDQIKITANIAGVTGSTYTTNLASILKVDTTPGTLVTSVTVSGGTVTFNSSNTMNEVVAIWGR